MRTNKSLNYSFLLLVLVFISPWFSITAQISGPVGIVPGEATQYNWSHFGYMNPTWSAPFGTFNSTTVQNPYLTISKNVNTPSIQLQVVSQDVSNPSQTTIDYKTVEVYPFITGPTNVNPGASITLVNQDNRAGLAGHNACYWNWSTSDLTLLTCSGNCNTSTSGSVVFTCPSTSPQSFYTISCTKYCGGGAYAYASQIRVNVNIVAPGLPTPIINGPSEISCGANLSNLIYSVNNVPQATYYEWELPAGWYINGNSHSNSISVANMGNPGGIIKVTAYSSQNSTVKSDVGSFGVGCCFQTLTITAPVSNGNTDRKQADYSINASNIVNAGATAKYHAGTFVNLSAGFSAIAESNVHIYPEICTSTYLRMNHAGNSGTEENSASSGESSSEPINTRLEEKEFFLEIFPNPTDGSFKLMLDKTKELPETISLKDVLGKEIQLLSKPMSYEYEFDLSKFGRGIYFLNLLYPDKTLSKKIIKN